MIQVLHLCDVKEGEKIVTGSYKEAWHIKRANMERWK